jgi:hypothetical protein
MARRAEDSSFNNEDVNLLLFTAWEHGARHVVLRAQGEGMEISYLDPNGGEHSELLALPYSSVVKHLRQMSARLGRVRVEMGGHQWHLEAVAPGSRRPAQVFLHMRPTE